MTLTALATALVLLVLSPAVDDGDDGATLDSVYVEYAIKEPCEATLSKTEGVIETGCSCEQIWDAAHGMGMGAWLVIYERMCGRVTVESTR